MFVSFFNLSTECDAHVDREPTWFTLIIVIVIVVIIITNQLGKSLVR